MTERAQIEAALLEARQRLAQGREAERIKIAHELHDEIVQELVALNYRLSHLQSGLGPDAQAQVAQIQDHVRQILGDARRLCADLRPPSLETLGVVQAIRYRLQALARRVSFAIHFVVDGDEAQRLPDDVALCLFRAVQEALSNVERHAAGVTEVEVCLVISPRIVRLSVIDDGCGFQMPAHLTQLLARQHFGLVGLRERVELVKGRLDVFSTPGHGTRLEAVIPFAEDISSEAGPHESPIADRTD